MEIKDLAKEVKANGSNIISFRLTHVPTGLYVERLNMNHRHAKVQCDEALKELEEKVEESGH